jgi:hypothetical protein
MSLLRNWWRAGEEDAVAIYRARIALPLGMLTLIVGGVIGSAYSASRLRPVPVLMAMWVMGAVVLTVRRRRAAIFTADSFLSRPVFGEPVRFPIGGIRRVSRVEPDPGDKIPVPTIRIELIVGGALDIPISISHPDQVISRLGELVGAQPRESS